MPKLLRVPLNDTAMLGSGNAALALAGVLMLAGY
jgi:hypothetical protein